MKTSKSMNQQQRLESIARKIYSEVLNGCSYRSAKSRLAGDISIADFAELDYVFDFLTEDSR